MTNARDPSDGASAPLDTGAYSALRALAARALASERRDHTLAPTDLVHETWLRLARDRDADANHGLSLRVRAARTMRQILVDHARRRAASKRDAGRTSPLDTDAQLAPLIERDAYVIELDRALQELADLAPDLAAVVELRFFGGCSVEETADELGLSPRTVKRRWQLAKGWLHREIADGGSL